MYSGNIVPLVTPLDEGGAVDRAGVGRLVETVRRDVTALMPALGTGEGEMLSREQWLNLVQATVHQSHGLPVLAGVLLPETGQVIERALIARTLGVKAVVVAPPFEPDISQADIYRHYEWLRDAVDLPIFVYHEAAKTGNAIEFETLLRILRIPGVVGIKESNGSAEATRRLVGADHNVPVFEGWENLLLEVRGVAGLVGPLANLEPAICTAMLREPSQERQNEINDLCKRLGLFEDDWFRRIKVELVSRGVIASARTVDVTGER